jgi:hypothetical protein
VRLGRLAQERPVLEKFRGLTERRLNEAEYLAQPRRILAEMPRIAVEDMDDPWLRRSRGRDMLLSGHTGADVAMSGANT